MVAYVELEDTDRADDANKVHAHVDSSWDSDRDAAHGDWRMDNGVEEKRVLAHHVLRTELREMETDSVVHEDVGFLMNIQIDNGFEQNLDAQQEVMAIVDPEL